MPIYTIIQSFRLNYLNEMTKNLVGKKRTCPTILSGVTFYFDREILIRRFHRIFLLETVKLLLNVPKNSTKAPHMFISSAFFQKYEPFVDLPAKVLMAETVAPTPDRMFVEIRYKSLYMDTYKVKQIISPPIKLFTFAEIFICKQRSNKILT